MSRWLNSSRPSVLSHNRDPFCGRAFQSRLRLHKLRQTQYIAADMLSPLGHHVATCGDAARDGRRCGALEARTLEIPKTGRQGPVPRPKAA